MKSAIVTIGTEITDGQIVNRNSSWLSKKLEALNLNSILHLSVPDERELMIMALTQAMEHADLIFVSGGLGPTSDDFTRDIIAEVAGKPLVLDRPAWANIETKIKSRGLEVKEGHRRQAMIPEGAQVLENNFGVAPAFTLSIGTKRFWTLPGPPREIEAVWNDHIHPELLKLAPKRTRHLTTWLMLGAAESDIAHMTEEFFKAYAFNKDFGYRLSAPYVEVKLWTSELNNEIRSAFLKYEELTSKYFVGHSQKEIYKRTFEKFDQFKKIEIWDAVTQGLAAQKLIDLSQEQALQIDKFVIHTQFNGQLHVPEKTSSGTLMISLLSKDSSNYEIIYTTEKGSTVKLITIPHRRTTSYIKSFVLERGLLDANSIA